MRDVATSSRASWCVYLARHDQVHDKLVAAGLTEQQARTEAKRRNDQLNDEQGVPARAPFAFYYAIAAHYV